MKKSFALVAVLAMIVLLMDQPLAAAKERRGSTVEVIMTDSSQVKGELLAVKADVILVYDRAARQGKSIDLQNVAQVKVLKKSKFLLGFAIGFGVLFGPCIYGYIQSHGQGLLGIDMIFGLSAIPGFCGGIIGALVSADKKLSLAGASSQISQQNLERLKHYAREQDFEKPAAN